MAGHLKITESEDPDVFGIRRPTAAQVGMFGLALVQAADLAGVVPNRTGAAVAVASMAAGSFLKGCVRRRR